MKILMVASDDPTFRFYAQSLVEQPLFFSSESGRRSQIKELANSICAQSPDVVHFQHEYGCFGSKKPWLYGFPHLVHLIKQQLPATCLVATAHTVLQPGFQYPLSGRGRQIPARIFANLFMMPVLNRLWGEKTWGALDGVIVHSSLQKANALEAGARRVWVVPHFVPALKPVSAPKENETFRILVFGYFTPEKGQDLVIEALNRMKKKNIHVVFAGGVRRSEDQGYYERCQMRIKSMGLVNQARVTGFISTEELNQEAAQSHLAIAPFRETHGSGSLVHLLGRGLPILASDLAINREINERQKGTMEFFKSEDVIDLSLQIERLSSEKGRETLLSLRENAKKYSASVSPAVIQRKHLEIYEDLEKTTHHRSA